MTRQMVDSAFPLGGPPPGGWPECILIYAGGDTPHPWTKADLDKMPSRYRWPCWVRSDPQDVNAGTEGALFVAWLRGFGVPAGTAVILDLETAVNTKYVEIFNLTLRAAGYKVTKYGSQSTIWQNPQTDGGTFVALPGSNVLTTEGDTVARQYGFEGGYDRSILMDQAQLPLWDTQPAPPPPHDAAQPTHVTASARWTNATISWVNGAGVQSIEVYLADASGKTIRKAPLGPMSVAYKFGHLDKGTTYKLGVLAKPEAKGVQAHYVEVRTK